MVRCHYFSVFNSGSNGVAAVVTRKILVIILVSECGHSLCLGGSTASLALLMASTLGSTSRIYVNDPLTGSMSVRRNSLLLYKYETAKSAYITGSDAGFGTCSLYTGNLYSVVSECLNKSVTTNLAKLGVKARCVNSGSMTESIAVGLATGSASLGSNAVSRYPIMTERITKRKCAKLTSLGSSTSSIYKRVCAKSGMNGNGNILGNVLHLKCISLDTVGSSCGKQSHAVTRGESVLYADHKIEYSVFTLFNGKGVAKQDGAILFRYLYGNYESSELNGECVGANVAYVVTVIIRMCCNSRFFTALTLMEVDERIGLPSLAKSVLVFGRLIGGELILEHNRTRSERKQKNR